MSRDTLASQYRSQLKQQGAQASAQVESAHAQAVQQIQPHLEQLYQEISAKQPQQQEGTQSPFSWIGKRLERVGQVVNEQIGNFAHSVKGTIDQFVQWAFSLGQHAGQAFFPGSSPVSQSTLTTDQSLFDGFAAEATKEVRGAFVRAISLKSKISTLAKEVTQALDASRWRSLTILDTELFKAFNAAIMAHIQEYAAGWVWHCQLSPRSCACCVALHGTMHRMDEQLQDHPNGSCIKIPYVIGMPAIQTGLEWFALQDEETQRAILGTKIAWELYQSGAGLQAFVGIHHDATYGTSVYQKSAKELKKGR